MIDIYAKRCNTLHCYTRSTTKYNGYCTRCYINLYPELPVSRNYKTKERTVVEYVTNKYSNYTWITDKKIQDGCSKRRPDLLLDLGYQILIIEVDESQHDTYDCICENKRIMEISKDLQHRNIVFIRFNPDSYTTSDGKVSSCWSYNKNGTCIVKLPKEKEWNTRLDTLSTQIQYWIENVTDKTIETVHLFYTQ
jgi:hypothetical protein